MSEHPETGIAEARLYKTETEIVCQVTDVWGFVRRYVFARGDAAFVRAEVEIPDGLRIPFLDDEPVEDSK